MLITELSQHNKLYLNPHVDTYRSFFSFNWLLHFLPCLIIHLQTVFVCIPSSGPVQTCTVSFDGRRMSHPLSACVCRRLVYLFLACICLIVEFHVNRFTCRSSSHPHAFMLALLTSRKVSGHVLLYLDPGAYYIHLYLVVESLSLLSSCCITERPADGEKGPSGERLSQCATNRSTTVKSNHIL